MVTPCEEWEAHQERMVVYLKKREEEEELRRLAKWLLIAQILIFAIPVISVMIFIWFVKNFGG